MSCRSANDKKQARRRSDMEIVSHCEFDNRPARRKPRNCCEDLPKNEASQVEGGGRWNPDCPLPPGEPHWDNHLYYGFFNCIEGS